MSVKTTTVPAQTSKQYNRLPSEQKNALSALIADSLTEKSDLLDVMDYLSFKVTRHGLTQDKLNELLAD